MSRLSRSAKLLFWPFVALALLLSSGCSKEPSSAEGNLLQGILPTSAQGVGDPERLTDGVVAIEGDHWETDVTSTFKSRGGSVEYDLGAPKHLAGAYAQGDNNDRFELWVADESRNFVRAWTAESLQGAGMRARHTNSLDVTARFVQVRARGGDPAVSLSEIQLFTSVPDTWPPELPARRGKRPGNEADPLLLAFAAMASAALLLHRKSWPMVARFAVILATAAIGAAALKAVFSMYPVREPQINLLRAVAAGVAVAAVLRMGWSPGDMMPRYVKGVLASMAALAVATFYNLGYPQFEDVANEGHTYVHTWDMRVYYPTAKYFDEIGFDGLYVGSVKAYAEDVPNSLPRRIGHVELRDLRDYKMTRVENVLGEIEAVKHRFTPERWDEFRRDMAYFRQTMGSGSYLGSLRDHGGNATPAWLLIANLMFRNTTATELTLLAGAALDPLLLLLFFGVAWRTFGLTTALVCLVVYGTTTFPMFGSNWGGSTLRNDWMVLLGLGVCALKARRHFTGGVLLASGAMIRAFPAFAVFALPLPAAWWLFETYRERKKLPSFSELYAAQRPLFRTLAGVLACVVTLTVASSALFGFKESWGEWAHKISMHSVKPNVNHVGLRTVVAYDPEKSLAGLHRNGGGDWSREQVVTLRQRMPLYVGLIAAYTLVAALACRRRGLDKAALVGLMMIPIWLYPSNYYLHYVFVLPLLFEHGEDSRQRQLWGFVCAIVLGMSIAQYFGFETRQTDERYMIWSLPVLAGYALILALLAGLSQKLARPSGAATVPAPVAPDAPA